MRWHRNFGSVLSLLLLFVGCAAQKPALDAESLQMRYHQAILDAQVAEPKEISTNLTAITPTNNKLIWQTFDSTSYLAVVTWTSWNGYDDRVGESLVLQREVWVTVVPELRDFCQNIDTGGIGVDLRLEQLLGLPPQNGKTKFIELWVKPEDLFRPAPDPEISDFEAELDFPVSERFIKIDPAHKTWFNQLKSSSYGADGYPWTRLGYTYDWGNPKSEIGLSEFVIRAGAQVRIASVTPTTAYCRASN